MRIFPFKRNAVPLQLIVYTSVYTLLLHIKKKLQNEAQQYKRHI